MLKSIFYSALALVGIVNAGVSTGACPTPDLQANFDATKYMGLWHEQARDKTMPWESYDCQQARYSINADGTVAVHNSQYNPVTDKVDDARAVATFDGPRGKVVFFPYAPAGDYRVLSTDYENWALVYSCDNYYVARTEYVWVLTREQEPTEAYITAALKTLKEKVPEYDQTLIRRTLQGPSANCKYLQETA
jgi:apolipoprotein D and lipocalin family protein